MSVILVCYLSSPRPNETHETRILVHFEMAALKAATIFISCPALIKRRHFEGNFD
ncbi:Uncharacterized protein APZ42_031818 [Daphnia magna]|uniref:Uncharacterized protein n=1 Tax=Daphnia magna TaxID=35525 RepID=A0A164MI89_9CRUS|nr:Uncharacterized protein APZ42_031818 [Daphnia magna]